VPEEWSKLLELVLKAAGVKSWDTFVRSAKDVIVRFETNRVVFIPTKNLGPRDGFVALPERESDRALRRLPRLDRRCWLHSKTLNRNSGNDGTL
jgi:hypothetical protein